MASGPYLKPDTQLSNRGIRSNQIPLAPRLHLLWAAWREVPRYQAFLMVALCE